RADQAHAYGSVMHLGVDGLHDFRDQGEVGVPGPGQHERVVFVTRLDAYQPGVLALGDVHPCIVENHEPSIARETPRLNLRFAVLDAITTLDGVRVQPAHAHATTLLTTRDFTDDT